MRARLMTTAAAIAIATPAFAADLYTPQYVPPVSSPVYSPTPMSVVGDLSLGIGFFDPSSSDTVGIFTGNARANIPFGGAWNLELETGGGALFKNSNSASTIGAVGHLWTKLNSAAIGAFGGVNFPSGTTFGTAGIEAETYIGNVTLGADASYNWNNSFDYWNIGGWADLYFAPNWRFGGTVDYFTSGGSSDFWDFGLNTEYRFAGTPISGWGTVDYATANGGSDLWIGMLGFSVALDPAGTSQEDHDRLLPWQRIPKGGRLGLLIEY